MYFSKKAQISLQFDNPSSETQREPTSSHVWKEREENIGLRKSLAHLVLGEILLCYQVSQITRLAGAQAGEMSFSLSGQNASKIKAQTKASQGLHKVVAIRHYSRQYEYGIWSWQLRQGSANPLPLNPLPPTLALCPRRFSSGSFFSHLENEDKNTTERAWLSWALKCT